MLNELSLPRKPLLSLMKRAEARVYGALGRFILFFLFIFLAFKSVAQLWRSATSPAPTLAKTSRSKKHSSNSRNRTSKKLNSGSTNKKVPSWLHDLPKKPLILKNSNPSNPPKYSTFKCLKNKLCSLNNIVLFDRQLWVFLPPQSTVTLPDIPFQSGPFTPIDSINLEYEPLPQSALDIKSKLADEPVILLPRFETLWET